MASAGVHRPEQFAPDDDFVPFYVAGEQRVGELQCAACGYGIVSHRTLPPCPMCQGGTWESPPRSFGGATER